MGKQTTNLTVHCIKIVTNNVVWPHAGHTWDDDQILNEKLKTSSATVVCHRCRVCKCENTLHLAADASRSLAFAGLPSESVLLGCKREDVASAGLGADTTQLRNFWRNNHFGSKLGPNLALKSSSVCPALDRVYLPFDATRSSFDKGLVRHLI